MSKTKTPTTKPKKKPRWTALSSSLMPDPKISEKSAQYGKTFVLVTTLLDDQGRLWERVGKDPPVMLGTPPAVNDKAG